MAFPHRKILITLSLLLLAGGSISALTKLPPARKSPASRPATEKAAQNRAGMQLVKHDDGELILEWNCPDLQVERDSATHRIMGLSMSGAQSVSRVGVPRLPELSQLLDCLPGKVTAQVIEMDADTRPLGEMLATPEDFVIDPPPDDSPSRGTLDDPGSQLSLSERSARTPLTNGMWPPQTVLLSDAGIFRGHRMMAVNVFPVQVDAARGIAHVARRIRVRVTMPKAATAAASRIADQPDEIRTVRNMLGALATTALATRMPEALEGRGSDRNDRLDDFDPLHPRYKIIVKQRGIVRVNYGDLQFAGCPMDQVTTHDLHVKNRGHEIPIWFPGEEDGHFDEQDYVMFYGTPNERTYQSETPTLYQDPWTDENVYWLSWGDSQSGLRLANEDVTYHTEWSPQQAHPVSHVRSTFHFERDERYERLPYSTDQFARAQNTLGPLGIHEDHWFWGARIDALDSRSYNVYLPWPDAQSLTPITVRAALQGASPGGDSLGQHRVLLTVNGQTAPGLQVGKLMRSDHNISWYGQRPIILQSLPPDSLVGIPTQDLSNGFNTITVSLPGDGMGGLNDKVLVNWFEVSYDRALHAAPQGFIDFDFDSTRGDTFSFEVRGFASRNISIWKLDRARLTNASVRRVSPADESPSWAARFQMIADQPYKMLLFDERYVQTPEAVVPETSTRDLRTLPGARYLIIYHDSFGADLALPWLQRLDSLRRTTFAGSVDTIRVSQIYEQFNDGIVNPEAIQRFLKYAYEHWPVRPTHVCLVGDGVMEYKYTGARAGDLISSLYPLTYQYGSTACDMLFGCVSGPPWDILPDIAVGRISCRSAQELESYVRKLIAYEDPAQTAYNSLYHTTALFVADKNDSRVGNFGLGFSEPVIQLLPNEMNVTRVYLDSIPSGQGPNRLRDAFRNGAILVNYNGHGAGGDWASPSLMEASTVRQLNNHRAYPFITNFTCYVGAFDDRDQSQVLGEQFLFAQNSRLDPVGGVAVYASVNAAFAFNGLNMQKVLYSFCANMPGMTIGEIVQRHKIMYWSGQYLNTGEGAGYIQFGPIQSLTMGMTLLGDPGAGLKLPQQVLQDVTVDSALTHVGATLHVSGVLPWEPSGTPTDVYLLPYNGEKLTYTRIASYDPARQETVWVYTVDDSRLSHLPAFNPDLIFPQQVTSRTFSNLSVPITAQLATAQGHLLVYAVNPGRIGVPPQDAVRAIPLFLADSMQGLTVFSGQVLPDSGYSANITIFHGMIRQDSVFQLQVSLMHPAGVARVRMRGVFQPAQGPVALDTVEMTEVEPGLWRSPDLGPYSVFNGVYRVRFYVQPPGGEFIATSDYVVPVEGRNNYLINTTNGIFPHPVADTQPMYYVPVGSARALSARNVSDLPVRLTATHDTTFIVHRPPFADSIAHVTLDSFATTIDVRDLNSLPTLFETRIPTYFWPQSYRVVVNIDPDNVIPETYEGDNFFTDSVRMPNLYPATNTLGTYIPRTQEGNTFHRFYKQGIRDTIRLKVLPGSFPTDSTTLIYLGPRTMQSAELANLSRGGILQTGGGLPDSLRNPVHIFRVVMTDSGDALIPGGQAQVTLDFARCDSLELSELSIFEKRAVSLGWRKLPNNLLSFVRHDTLTRQNAQYIVYSGRITATASDLGEFAVFRFHDSQGPIIEISVDGMHFTPHSILPRHPNIFANLNDPSGIDRNPGKFLMTIDHDTIHEADITWSDSLLSGGSMSALIRPSLEPGHHVLSVKATDNTGISDSTAVEFEVSGAFGIEWAINYPNPFKKNTTIAYLLTDMADQFVECKIYTVSGRYIATVREAERVVANYREITWDGRDDGGNEVANGVYFARLKAKQGKQEVEKMIKLAKVR